MPDSITAKFKRKLLTMSRMVRNTLITDRIMDCHTANARAVTPCFLRGVGSVLDLYGCDETGRLTFDPDIVAIANDWVVVGGDIFEAANKELQMAAGTLDK